MIYIIISNIGFAIMTLVMFIRYSHFRLTSQFTIKDLKKKLDDEIVNKNAVEERLKNEIKEENSQNKKFINDISNLHKEKESELKLRLEAEKQIAVALQKIAEVQKRLNDWKAIQDNALNDSKSAILKVTDDLYNKLSTNNKNENVENREFIDKTLKNFQSHLENISKNVDDVKSKTFLVSKNVDEANASLVESIVSKAKSNIDESSKQFLDEIVSIIKAAGYKQFEHYILANNLDATKSSLMLCELIFIKEKKLYLIDLKSSKVFAEYYKLKNIDADSAVKALSAKMEKYLSYITNPKYIGSHQKLFSDSQFSSLQIEEFKTMIAINTKNEFKLLKENKITEKFEEQQILVYDFDKLSDLIL